MVDSGGVSLILAHFTDQIGVQQDRSAIEATRTSALLVRREMEALDTPERRINACSTDAHSAASTPSTCTCHSPPHLINWDRNMP